MQERKGELFKERLSAFNAFCRILKKNWLYLSYTLTIDHFCCLHMKASYAGRVEIEIDALDSTLKCNALKRDSISLLS